MNDTYKYVLILIFSVLVSSVSQIILKKSSVEEHKSLIREHLNFKVILGYGLLVLSTILTVIALKGISYKSEPIIESIGYIFIMILSRIFLKEKITVRKVIGNALILIGILVFNI